MSDPQTNSTEPIPEGCGDEDLLRLIDLCPFLAMVEACPIALGRRLSGRRNVLHYAIAEGANVDVIRYLASRMPSLVTEVDSFGALPLHLASTYFPSSSPLVLLHLLGLHPEAARAVDNKSRTPLHRACASRASMEKVLALIEAYPPALFMNDWMRTTPLGYAESMHQRLSEPMPAVIEVLGMAMDILGTNEDDDDVAPPSSSALYDGNDHVAGIVVDGGRGGGEGGDGDRARRILEHFRPSDGVAAYDRHPRATSDWCRCWTCQWPSSPDCSLSSIRRACIRC
ncbi:hypothetical protein ACHAXA_002783 [Cyclostephanos tholiformis]|uniref:Uncharacterized protein n=1 Tax=Cyclostephanos tholiformis TaxID=382380 RepID=A0ABD3RK00_9STRA